MLTRIFKRKKKEADHPLNSLSPFKGMGTYFISTLIGFNNFKVNITPEKLVEVLYHYLTYQHEIIESHKGIVIQFEGDTTLAFWHPDHKEPSHAQRAFNASLDIISSIKENIPDYEYWFPSINISLGTGQMAGDFFSSLKGFQVVGPAFNLAEILLREKRIKKTGILLSSSTLNLLSKDKSCFTELGQIKRDAGELTNVFGYME